MELNILKSKDALITFLSRLILKACLKLKDFCYNFYSLIFSLFASRGFTRIFLEKKIIMRCAFYCIAEQYRLSDLSIALCQQQKLAIKTYDDVVHVSQTNHRGEVGDWFCFSYGCLVFWGFDQEFEKKLIDSLKIFANQPIKNVIDDSCTYEIGNETIIYEEEDQIILESNNPLIKLSLSHGMAQSVKLVCFEETIARTIEKTKFLSSELSTKGKISLSRKKIAQQIGALFAQRNSINLHNDILDTPEFFWKRPKYEPFYHMAIDYLDINTRLDILNRKLDVIHELYNMLSNELKHSHSSFLEIVIIVLLIIEVAMVLLKDVLHWI
jgi:uncharacterized Rmd1/YagE family protein